MMVETRSRVRGHRSVARERAAVYLLDTPGLSEAVEALEAAIDQLARVDLDAEPDEALRSAAVELARQANRGHAQQLRLLEAVDRRAAYRFDGAVTTASWYRHRTRLNHGEATRQVNAATRLRRLTELRSALEYGDITLSHVTAVTEGAIPRRMEAISACEEVLVDLAMTESPWQVRRAVRYIADHADPDGSDSPPIDDTGPDERRYLQLRRWINGLWKVDGVLDTLAGEKLAAVLDAAEAPDPADTPAHSRRSAAQRRHDALEAALDRLLASGDLPSVHGVKPHMLVTVDLLTLVGRDHEAARRPRLRYGGEITPLLARQIALFAKLTVVLTLGPWRVVNVGRTHRTLPSWLRAILELVHRQCRGPDCDRRITWSQAHHQLAWEQGGETDLNATIPLCQKHHDLVTTGQWTVTFDPDTGTCTWTGPAGQVRAVDPVTP